MLSYYNLLRSLLWARLMGQYCFARWHLSSSVTPRAGGLAAQRKQSTLHSGPVVLYLPLVTLFHLTHHLTTNICSACEVTTIWRYTNVYIIIIIIIIINYSCFRTKLQQFHLAQVRHVRYTGNGEIRYLFDLATESPLSTWVGRRCPAVKKSNTAIVAAGN